MGKAALNRRTATALQEQWARPAVAAVSLQLPFPVSVNALWRRTSRGVSRSPRYATWFRAAGNELNTQRPGRVKGPYALTITLGRPDRRKHDLDNLVKAVSDLLVEHKVIDDDSEALHIALQWGPFTGAHVLVETMEKCARRGRLGAAA